jgi:hypothetical protein
MVVSGELLPARETGVSEPRTHLDDFMPAYQFNEFHSVRVKASREQVYRAIKSVTADEITFFRTLVWMRRMGRSGPESILNPPPGEPILDVATRTSFIVLAEEPDREIVLGTLVAAPPGWRPTGKATPAAFKALRKPGFALAAMNFRLDEDEAAPGTTIVTTETRVYATDADVCRRFGGYWRVIYPGSALIRRMWLRATVKRTQGARQPS